MNLSCMFWNVNGKHVDSDICTIAESTNANIIVLAEYKGDSQSLLQSPLFLDNQYYELDVIGCTYIRVITKINSEFIKRGREADRYTFNELSIPGKDRILFGLVHLASKLHSDDYDQLSGAEDFIDDLIKTENDFGHSNTIVAGDFNMNPFDPGMMSIKAFNSVPCRVVAGRETRKVNDKQYQFFYNPSWNLLGDFSGSPGTYYHSSPSTLSHYWNTLDQVLLRPQIANRLVPGSLRIVTNSGNRLLVNKHGIPNISDHLPIVFKINLE